MSAQLGARLPGFADAIVQQPALQRLDVKVEVGTANAAVYGVYIEKFIVQRPSADEAFQALVRDPLKQWSATSGDGRAVTLLIDGLDEAARLTTHPHIADLLRSAADLPDRVRCVVTSRPSGPLATRARLRRIVLDKEEGYRTDAKAYVAAALAEPPLAAALAQSNIDPADVQRKLVERDDVNQLYLYHALGQLRIAATERRPLELDRLPATLYDVYREYLDCLFETTPERWAERYRPLFGVLAVAEEAIGFPVLCDLTEIDDEDLNDAIEAVKPFIESRETDGAPAYHLYHASLSDFLCDRARNPTYFIDLAKQHDQTARRALKRWAATKGTAKADLTGTASYALRHAAQHLARAAALWGDARPDKALEATRSLVELALDRRFVEAHERNIDQMALLSQIMEDAVRCSAEHESPEALFLASKAALGFVTFDRTRFARARLFDCARRGDLAGAERLLDRLRADSTWRAVARLLISWVAPLSARESARQIRSRTAPVPNLRLWQLNARVEADLEGFAWRAPLCPAVSEDEANAILERVVGMVEGRPIEGRWEEITETGLGNVEGPRTSEHDCQRLVTYAISHPDRSDDILTRYLRAVASNTYVWYRNRFLEPLLGAIISHPDRASAQHWACAVASEALSPTRLSFSEAFPIAVLAVQAARDAGARRWFEARVGEVVQAARPLCRTEPEIGWERFSPDVVARPVSYAGVGDVWGSFTRRLAAAGHGFALLGDKPRAQALFDLALHLHHGYAGLQAPASWTLAESARVAGADAPTVTAALLAAERSAHNVMEPAFCAQTTARIGTLRATWWGDARPAFDVRSTVQAFLEAPRGARFAPFHRAGETYPRRHLGFQAEQGGSNPPMPLLSTLEDIAKLLQISVSELERLQPGVAADMPLSAGHPVPLPDPEMAALLAARFSSELLLDPSLGEEERAAWIRRLVPIAAQDPTALDLVLARMVLAWPGMPADVLAGLASVARSALEGSGCPSWLSGA